jgi:hypothetical protein
MPVLKPLRFTPMFQNGYDKISSPLDRLVDENNKKNLKISRKHSKRDVYIFDGHIQVIRNLYNDNYTFLSIFL